VKRLKYWACQGLLSGTAWIAASTVCGAQPVYRCGNSYSQTPCANGVVVQTDDARSEEQRTAAQQVVSEQKRQAAEMEATRKKDEALAYKYEQTERAAHARRVAAKTRDASIRDAKPHKKPAKLRTVKVAEDGVFTTTAGNPKPKKTKSDSNAP
jgi:hypothetical protein